MPVLLARLSGHERGAMTGSSQRGAPELLAWLCGLQNRDGGWPYHAGRNSWVEPTAYALLATGGADAGSPEFRRASAYLLALQNSEGSWPASALAPGSHWTTSLCVSVGVRFAWPEKRLKKAVEWLIGQYGAEGRLLGRLGHFLNPRLVEYDPRWHGWGWTPGASSWVEPTSHAMLALLAARKILSSSAIDDRLESARRLLLDRRCSDGGWNYGNRRVRGADLPGYPQTTAVALLALRGEPRDRLGVSIARATAMYQSTDSALARSWLAHALRAHGEPMVYQPGDAPQDVITTALEALAVLGQEPA